VIVVIQCAATKRLNAKRLRTLDGREVQFVADPNSAPPSDFPYAQPDDASDRGHSWRQLLGEYNQRDTDNPLGLSRALELYKNPVYGALGAKFGLERTYILSAGWGLIAGSFLLPNYDITFSQNADQYKRRGHKALYKDFCMLPITTSEPIIFVGGKDYIPFFVRLTSSINAPKTVFFNSRIPPEAPGCSLKQFETSTRTNWHYACARALISEYR